ncbi:MAG: hypothetical protein QOH93_283, partial [Chloroflexia bacterium]|nr:hypothetical protein [Chloroflexia bacterium]
MLACALLLVAGIGPAQRPARAQTLVDPAGSGITLSPLVAHNNSELFGMVARDPFYEFNSDTV